MQQRDLEEAYSSVPLNKISQKFVRFQWWSNPSEFLYLCFGLVPTPRIFAKLLKVRIAILRRVNIRIIIVMAQFVIKFAPICNGCLNL